MVVAFIKGPFITIDIRGMVFKGDYNCVRTMDERVNCLYREADTNSFNSFMAYANMLELTVMVWDNGQKE